MTARRNGCYNGQRGAALAAHTYPVQDGWVDIVDGDLVDLPTRLPVIRQQAHVMTTDCQYSIRTTDDPGCVGCKWKHAALPETVINQVSDAPAIFLR